MDGDKIGDVNPTLPLESMVVEYLIFERTFQPAGFCASLVLGPGKTLSQYICDLIFGGNMLYFQLSTFQCFTNEMMTNIYVLASSMKRGIFSKLNSAAVVAE